MQHSVSSCALSDVTAWFSETQHQLQEAAAAASGNQQQQQQRSSLLCS
jgi:hypothetical protein